MRELVLDTETTGLDPKDGHRVIELACVELINYIPTGTSWHWYFNPQRDVPKASTDVHGLTARFLADKPLFGNVVQEIAELLAGARLIIHNAPFDMGFLNHEFGRLGLPPLSMENVTDTLVLARRKHPGSPNNLDALCRRYGIDNSTRTKHGALLDSELLADVYLRLIGAEQAGLDLTSRAGAGAVEAVTVVQVALAPLPPLLSPEEEAAHAAFVASMGEKAYSGTGICRRTRRRRLRMFRRARSIRALLPSSGPSPSKLASQRGRIRKRIRLGEGRLLHGYDGTPSPMGRGWGEGGDASSIQTARRFRFAANQ